MGALTLSDLQTGEFQNLKNSFDQTVDMKLVASIILSGGEGTRLFPLTLTRCKPDINFGGKYRLIDIPISNSIHADCYKTFILTQFLSSSLHRHIFQTYMQGGPAANFIEILTAEQKPSQKSWFKGTADAVRQNIDYLLEHPVEYFLILSGDQLYNINFREMVQFAKKTNADVTIAALPVNAHDATRMGILKVNKNHTITDFYEKPQSKELLENLRSVNAAMEAVNSPESRPYLGSMGIYLFKRKALVDLLKKDPREDFGKHLIPSQVQNSRALAFIYNGYWEDIGTIETFYQANLNLTYTSPQFCFYNQKRPIFTSRHDLPPAKFLHAHVKQAILCEGGMIEADEITHSLIGPRAVIQKGSIIRDSYIMGNDYYESAVSDHHQLPSMPHIGENCIISKAILDRNVVIGNGAQLINKDRLTHYNGENIFIRDGIIIVPRGSTIPKGFTL